MKVYINGEAREFSDQLPLHELVRELSLPPDRIAIELNHQVVRRKDWLETIIRDDDHLEIVHFVGGGTVHSKQ